MKKFTVIALIAITLFSCTKQANNKPASMTAEELKTKYFIELPSIDYGNGSARNNKPKANAVTVTVSEDLVISGSVSCTTSTDAEWGGIQKFLAIPLSNDGAVSYCNFNWSYTTAPASMDCATSASGVYRGWTSDHNYDVHLSNLITIP